MDDTAAPPASHLAAQASTHQAPDTQGGDRDSSSDKRKPGPIVLAAGVAAAAAIGTTIWIWLNPAEVSVITLAPRSVEIALSVVGRVQSRDTLDIRSENSGQIVELLHDEGDEVAKGSPLAVISSDVAVAEAGVVAAREQAARAEVAVTQLALARAERLAAQGAVSRAALDRARAAAQSAQAEMAASASDRRAMSARLGKYTVRAPMAGVVLLRPVDNGQVVTPATTLFQLGSAETREIEVEVDEAYADDLRPGMAARAAPTGSDAVFVAHIREVSPRVDPTTGARLISLAPDASMTLPPGRTVDVTIIIGVRPSALLLPREAILDAGAHPFVYVVDEHGKVDVQPVTLDAWPSLNAIITGGASAGDRIVLTPSTTHPSAQIRPREIRASAASTGE